MKLTTKQRKEIKKNGFITFFDNGDMNELTICYGVHNATEENKNLCNYNFDGYECMRASVLLNGKLLLISNTIKKVEDYIDTIDYLNFDFTSYSKKMYYVYDN
jgi:hypothetical protein